LSSLPPGALGEAHPPDADRLSSILGLGPETLMAISQYDVPQGRRPDTVWLIRYPTPEAARDAQARYVRLLESDTSGHARSTSVLDPHGRFLAGTWSAEEESLIFVLPRVVQLLPS
jgi:hypothetical protein